MTRIFTIKSTLMRALAQFISQDETRYMINGLFVVSHAAKPVVLYATDGRRMAKLVLKEQIGEGEEGTSCNVFVAHRDLFTAILSLCHPDSPAVIAVGFDGKIVEVRKKSADGPLITLPVIEGNFPNCDTVIPEPFPETWAVDTLAGYNSEFLASCAELSDAVFHKAAACSIGRTEDGLMCMRAGDPSFQLTVVLMPMRPL